MSSSLNYRPTAELKEDFGYIAVSEHFRAYYDVIPMGDGVNVKGVFQNISRTFASNVTLDVSECCNMGGVYSEKSYYFKNLGSIKMLSHKPFEFYIPSKEEKELVIAYEFMPSSEDSFIKPIAETPAYFYEPIKGKIKLILIKQVKNQ